MPADLLDQLNVLIVDDDATTREMLCDIVARHEHQAVPAESAEDILKLLPYWTFQVALLDHNLPGMDGLVLGAFLRRNNPDMAIALITGETGAALERKSHDLGLEYLPKPFRVQDILEIIDRYQNTALHRAEQRQQRSDDAFHACFGLYLNELSAAYDMPQVPKRIAERLVDTIKRSLNNLRSVARYNERDRTVALAGLLAARVLGLGLPRSPGGQTLFQEYDAMMREHGRCVEFEPET